MEALQPKRSLNIPICCLIPAYCMSKVFSTMKTYTMKTSEFLPCWAGITRAVECIAAEMFSIGISSFKISRKYSLQLGHTTIPPQPRRQLAVLTRLQCCTPPIGFASLTQVDLSPPLFPTLPLPNSSQQDIRESQYLAGSF
jgi:hypothetical protein